MTDGRNSIYLPGNQINNQITPLFEIVEKSNFENLFRITVHTTYKFQFIITLLSIIGFV